MKTGSGGSYDWLHSYLKTFSVWEPTGHKNGVSKRIQDGVTSTRARVEALREASVYDADVKLLSSGIVEDSYNFIIQLVTWVDKAHRELTADTTYSDQEVWDMQLECLE